MEMANTILSNMKSIAASQSNKRPPTIKQVPPSSGSGFGAGQPHDGSYYPAEKQPIGMGSPGGSLDLTGGYGTQPGYGSSPPPASPPRQTPTSMYGDPRYSQQGPPPTGPPQPLYPGGPPRPPPPPGHQPRMSGGYVPEQPPYGAQPGRASYEQQQPQPGYSVSSYYDRWSSSFLGLSSYRVVLSNLYLCAVTTTLLASQYRIDTTHHLPLEGKVNFHLMDSTRHAKCRSKRE